MKFINPEHQRIYNDAKIMYDAEIERQRLEWERLDAEWARYPDDIRAEKHAWLRSHFAECRRPYEKVLTDVVSICPTVIKVLCDPITMILPAADA